PKEVERETKAKKDKVKNTSLGSTTYVQPLVVQDPIPEPEVALNPKPKPLIPYPLRLNDQKLREKANNQMLKFLQIFQKLHFDICFADALLYMPKFASTFKSLLNPGKFLIPCDFPKLDECLALADLSASINLMPLSMWKHLSLPKLTSTRMTLELANRSTVIPKGVAEDVFVLGFLDSSTSGNLTPSDPIIASSSPSFTPFEGGDFVLEEIEACLSNDSIPPGIVDADFDPEGDIRLLKKLLNEDPSPTLPPMKNDDLKQVDVTLMKPSIKEPPKLEHKDLPSHLEYVFLEGTNKLPIIISKELKEEEKAAFLKVLKSHKRAIAWKISDIKGINPSFCTHKILIEDDFKPAVQHQRRMNPKIHEVIKKEVIKLLDAGLIYPISDSPWVSPVHCVPKKGGMTVVENEDNEFIPTRHVPKVHDGHFPQHDQGNNGGLHG
ncbi:hypothetical protein Tco_1463587, partial [Tanacetum coccineum]